MPSNHMVMTRLHNYAELCEVLVRFIQMNFEEAAFSLGFTESPADFQLEFLTDNNCLISNESTISFLVSLLF